MPLSKRQIRNILKKETEYFKIDKEHWDEIIKVNRKKVLKVFLAGASVATIVWWLVFLIYLNI